MCIAGFILNLLFELVGQNNYVNSLVLWAVSLNSKHVILFVLSAAFCTVHCCVHLNAYSV